MRILRSIVGPSAAFMAFCDSKVTGCSLAPLCALSEKDGVLLRHAIILRCEAFLTMERRLPRNAAHIERELGIRILTPIAHWEMLTLWAALWL